MQVHAAEITPYGPPITVLIVEPQFTRPGAGDAVLELADRYFRKHPVMLVSVEQNGFRSYATFQSHLLLALMQLENLDLTPIDLSCPAVAEDPIPF